MKRMLITGITGTLGRVVAVHALAAGYAVHGTYRRELPVASGPLDARPTTHQLDVADANAVNTLVDTLHPAVIVHTAAVLSGATLWQTNVEGTAHVAAAAQRIGARLVHLSSDAIFAGGAAPYDEQARPRPVNLYGASKAAAEALVMAYLPTACVVRTSLLVNRDGSDQHSRMILAILNGERAERLFEDEYRCPIAVEDVAAAVVELAGNSWAGILNVAGPDAVSRYELGRLVAAAHGRDPEAVPHTRLADTSLAAVRPADVRLDVTLAGRLLQTPLRGMRAYLEAPHETR